MNGAHGRGEYHSEVRADAVSKLAVPRFDASDLSDVAWLVLSKHVTHVIDNISAGETYIMLYCIVLIWIDLWFYSKSYS